MSFQSSSLPIFRRLLSFAGLVALAGLAPSLIAQPMTGSKAEPPKGLRAAFEQGDQMESRIAEPGVRLKGRDLIHSGLDPELEGLNLSSSSPAQVVASWNRFPTASDWQNWQDEGLRHLEYLGNRHWLMELSRDAKTVYSSTGAEGLFLYLAGDKVAPELSAESLDERFFDAEKNLVVVDVGLIPGLTQAARRRLISAFQAADSSIADDRSDARLVTLVVKPECLISSWSWWTAYRSTSTAPVTG